VKLGFTKIIGQTNNRTSNKKEIMLVEVGEGTLVETPLHFIHFIHI